MDLYYVNNHPQSNGDYEVHKLGCTYMPLDKKFLGSYSACEEAVKEAKRTYSQSNGCFFCSESCHENY